MEDISIVRQRVLSVFDPEISVHSDVLCLRSSAGAEQGSDDGKDRNCETAICQEPSEDDQ